MDGNIITVERLAQQLAAHEIDDHHAEFLYGISSVRAAKEHLQFTHHLSSHY